MTTEHLAMLLGALLGLAVAVPVSIYVIRRLK